MLPPAFGEGAPGRGPARGRRRHHREVHPPAGLREAALRAMKKP
jgi:hypothetical protein